MFKRLWSAWNELIVAVEDLRDTVRESRDRYRQLYGLDQVPELAETSGASSAETTKGKPGIARKGARS